MVVHWKLQVSNIHITMYQSPICTSVYSAFYSTQSFRIIVFTRYILAVLCSLFWFQKLIYSQLLIWSVNGIRTVSTTVLHSFLVNTTTTARSQQLWEYLSASYTYQRIANCVYYFSVKEQCDVKSEMVS